MIELGDESKNARAELWMDALALDEAEKCEKSKEEARTSGPDEGGVENLPILFFLEGVIEANVPGVYFFWWNSTHKLPFGSLSVYMKFYDLEERSMSQRERWPSTTLFIFAAVGSAVGLGNVWRFPYLVGKYGGGAFLFPYLIALFLIGFPILVMEFALGQMMQKGAVESWRKVKAQCRGIGLGSILCSFMICCYYSVIMAWCCIYAVQSFSLPWQGDTDGYFFNTVLQVSSGPSELTGFSIPVLLGLAFTWVAVYFCVWKGVKSVSNVVAITMPLPIILLFILLVRTFFLPGAFEGLAYFLKPDFTALMDPNVWMAAITQIFFTLSLGVGVMITYSSFQPKSSDIVRNALITAIADVSIAFVAGLVIFATIGYMSHSGEGDIAELAAAGPGLAFVVFPKALSLIPFAGLFAFIFFVMLITLGIDSLFSLVEAVASFFYDYFPDASKKIVAFYVCFACFIGGLVFTTSAGIYYLDITDHFVTNYALVLMGLLQVLAIGWIYGTEKMRKQIATVSKIPLGQAWDVTMRYIIPAALMVVLFSAFYHDMTVQYEDFPTWAINSFGWGLVVFICIVSGAYSIVRSPQR